MSRSTHLRKNTYNRLLRFNSPSLESIPQIHCSYSALRRSPVLVRGSEWKAPELQLEGTNLWIYPSEDHDTNLKRFFADPDSVLPGSISRSHPQRIRPLKIDFLDAPQSMSSRSHPYDWFSRWDQTGWQKRGADYEAFKQGLASRLLGVLYRHVPTVRDRIVHAELSTPLSTRHFANYAHGEIYGLAHTPDRFRLRTLRP